MVIVKSPCVNAPPEVFEVRLILPLVSVAPRPIVAIFPPKDIVPAEISKYL